MGVCVVLVYVNGGKALICNLRCVFGEILAVDGGLLAAVVFGPLIYVIERDGFQRVFWGFKG